MGEVIGFQFARERIVLYPLTIRLLRDDGSGETDERVLRVKYRLMGREQMRALLKSAQAAAKQGMDALTDDARAEELRELMHAHVLDLPDLIDENNQPIPFTAETLNAVLDRSALADALERGLWQASREATAKN